MGVLWTSNPSATSEEWFVWNMYKGIHTAVFFGSMEECGAVADALNAKERAS